MTSTIRSYLLDTLVVAVFAFVLVPLFISAAQSDTTTGKTGAEEANELQMCATQNIGIKEVTKVVNGKPTTEFSCDPKEPVGKKDCEFVDVNGKQQQCPDSLSSRTDSSSQNEPTTPDTSTSKPAPVDVPQGGIPTQHPSQTNEISNFFDDPTPEPKTEPTSMPYPQIPSFPPAMCEPPNCEFNSLNSFGSGEGKMQAPIISDEYGVHTETQLNGNGQIANTNSEYPDGHLQHSEYVYSKDTDKTPAERTTSEFTIINGGLSGYISSYEYQNYNPSYALESFDQDQLAFRAGGQEILEYMRKDFSPPDSNNSVIGNLDKITGRTWSGSEFTADANGTTETGTACQGECSTRFTTNAHDDSLQTISYPKGSMETSVSEEAEFMNIYNKDGAVLASAQLYEDDTGLHAIICDLDGTCVDRGRDLTATIDQSTTIKNIYSGIESNDVYFKNIQDGDTTLFTRTLSSYLINAAGGIAPGTKNPF